MNYTLEYAKRDYEAGYLDTVFIDRFLLPDSVGFVVMLGKGDKQGPLVDAREKKPRVFKSLDGAFSAVCAIGFRVDRLLPCFR